MILRDINLIFSIFLTYLLTLIIKLNWLFDFLGIVSYVMHGSQITASHVYHVSFVMNQIFLASQLIASQIK